MSFEVDNLLNDFRLYLLEHERSKNTVDSYIRSVKAFFNSFDELSKENLILFKQQEVSKHSPNTAALRCIAMNVFCDYLGKPEYKVQHVKIYSRTSVENVPTLDEYTYFLSKLKDDGNIKMYWMLRFIACTGARASELIRLEKSCLESGVFTLWTKGKVRKILIPQALIDESKDYFDSIDSVLLFPSRYGGPMQAQSISKMMAKYGSRYGLRSEILHPHAFRHLFAVLFLESNGNLTLLSNLLGHESIKTTSIYLQMSSNEQRNQLNKAVTW